VTAFVLGSGVACRGEAVHAPDPTADPAEPARPEAVVLRYDPGPLALQLTSRFELRTAGLGPQASAELEFVAGVAWAPAEHGVKVVWDIEDVRDLKLGGGFLGQGQGDPAAFVGEMGQGAFLSDVRGRTEAVASEALAENAVRNRRMAEIEAEIRASALAGRSPQYPAGAQIIDLLLPIVQLPTLPEPELRVGRPETVERQEERAFGQLGAVPLAIASTYTLRSIAPQGTALLAELELRGSTRGEGDTPQGHLGIASTFEGRLLFDLNARRPMAYEIIRSETWELGEAAGATHTELAATWTATPQH